jgi:hypothetical protein
MKLFRSSDRVRRVALAIAVGAVVASVGVWAQNDALVGVNYDDGIYAWLARSLADGDGYRITYTPSDVPGIKYPPIYPVSLVPFWKLARTPESAYRAMKIANGLYIGLAAGLFVFMLAELGILAAPVAVIITLLGFVSGSMMLATAGLLSEPLYLVLLFAALLAADRMPPGARVSRLAAVALLAGLVALTRMVGLTLILAVLVGLWWRCGRKSVMVSAAVLAVVIAPWLIFTLTSAHEIPELLVPRYGSYVQLYLSGVAGAPAAALSVAATNVGAILQTLGSKLAPRLGMVGQGVAGVSLLVFAVLGARAAFKTAPASATYPWLYLLVISTWSFPPFRFVFILFPLLLAFAAVGLPKMADWLAGLAERSPHAWVAARSRWLRLAVLTAAALLALDLGYREVRSVSRRPWDGAELTKSEVTHELIEWVGQNTATDDVIAYELDPMLALHAGRKTIPNNYEPLHGWYRRDAPPVEPLARMFRESGVDYVAVRSGIVAAMQPIDALMGEYPEALQLIHITPGGVIVLQVDQAALAVERRGGDR